MISESCRLGTCPEDKNIVNCKIFSDDKIEFWEYRLAPGDRLDRPTKYIKSSRYDFYDVIGAEVAEVEEKKVEVPSSSVATNPPLAEAKPISYVVTVHFYCIKNKDFKARNAGCCGFTGKPIKLPRV